jgi:hypothetical protein
MNIYTPKYKCTNCSEAVYGRLNEQGWCKSCEIADRIRNHPSQFGRARKRQQDQVRRYRLTHKELVALTTFQENKCASCMRKFIPTKLSRMALVDHCHKTNEVRGLLCMGCNTSLGKLRDSPQILQNLIDYLEEPPLTKLRKQLLSLNKK